MIEVYSIIIGVNILARYMTNERPVAYYSYLYFFEFQLHRQDAITITYGENYKPFAWGEKGYALGVQKDFVEEVLTKRLGIKVIHESCPWARCQILVKQGVKDGFFTVPTPQRKSYTIVTDSSFYETHFVMHSSKNNPNIKLLETVSSLSDLEKLDTLRHIHMLGSGWHINALKNMKDVTTNIDASNIPKMLKLLRADVYIEQAEMFIYQAKKAGVFDQVITFHEPSIRELGWHLFISKKSKYQCLMPRINQVLEALRDSGELEEIKQRIFMKYGIVSQKKSE